MGESKRIKLKTSPPGSTSWIYIADDSSLVVEFYDYGQEAEAAFGNDIAYLLKVAPEHKRSLLEALSGQSVEPQCAPKKLDSRLIRELEQRFGNYFEVRAWFDAESISYSHEFDSWA